MSYTYSIAPPVATMFWGLITTPACAMGALTAMSANINVNAAQRVKHRVFDTLRVLSFLRANFMVLSYPHPPSEYLTPQ